MSIKKNIFKCVYIIEIADFCIKTKINVNIKRINTCLQTSIQFVNVLKTPISENSFENVNSL